MVDSIKVSRHSRNVSRIQYKRHQNHNQFNDLFNNQCNNLYNNITNHLKVI